MFTKICGITNPTDVLMVARAGVQAIGLNFYPDSPRFVTIEQAHEILVSLPVYVDPVGLFVNPTSADVRQTAIQLGLKTVQLHGDISPSMVSDLSEFSVIVARKVKDPSDVDATEKFWADVSELPRQPSAILVDASVEGKHGGTGQTAPWDLAREIVKRISSRIILAGGLRAKNVAAAIEEVRPWGVDVASGVEVSAGRKESYKVDQFMKSVVQAEANLAR